MAELETPTGSFTEAPPRLQSTPPDVLEAIRSGLHFPLEAEKSVIRSFTPNATPVTYTGILRSNGFEIYPDDELHFFRANRGHDSMLQIVAKLASHGGKRDYLHLKDMFPLTLSYFEEMGKPIKGFRSTYQPTLSTEDDVVTSDNFKLYREFRKKGMTPQEAARSTKTGRVVSPLFPNIVIEAETSDEVRIAYYKDPQQTVEH